MAYAPRDVLADRHIRLRRALADRELDAVVITYIPNIFYLTNFTGSSAIVVLTADALQFITDFRYVTAVQAAWASPAGCPGASLVKVETTYDDAVSEQLKRLGAKRVGFEAARVPFAQYGRWSSASGHAIEFVPTERLVEGLRVRKDGHEIDTLRHAAALLDGAFSRFIRQIRSGMTEMHVAATIDFVMKECGFARPAFDTIVASGPNGALPHARPGDRVLSNGDLVVLDLGGVYDGYCVDLTRTISIGQPDGNAERVYAAVTDAHAAGVAASRAGATARDIDRAARGTLERIGYGEAFGHSTGHGLGVEVHEEPWLVRTKAEEEPQDPDKPSHSQVMIETGMVFTIEPGVYLPGWGGVRLEDDVVVTADGPEMITHVPRELMVIEC